MELQELLDKLTTLRKSITETKRYLKMATGDSLARMTDRFTRINEEYDLYMLLKVQHDLLTYIRQGGIPLIKKINDKYEVSIPGSQVCAYVNEDGLAIINKEINASNSTTAQILCTQDESPPHQV